MATMPSGARWEGEFTGAWVGLGRMGGQGIGFGFQCSQVCRVLGGGQGGPTQVAFRCGFEQVLKDQRCLGLVEKPDARPFDGEGGGGMFSHRGERLLRVSAMNGRVLGQLVEDRLLRCELPQAELFDFRRCFWSVMSSEMPRRYRGTPAWSYRGSFLVWSQRSP